MLSHHLYHIPLVGSRSQVLPSSRGGIILGITPEGPSQNDSYTLHINDNSGLGQNVYIANLQCNVSEKTNKLFGTSIVLVPENRY